jgi:hypothetical protein
MVVLPAPVETDKLIDHYLKRIARLEKALRDIRNMGQSLSPPHDFGWRAQQIAADALSEDVR